MNILYIYIETHYDILIDIEISIYASSPNVLIFDQFDRNPLPAISFGLSDIDGSI